MEEAEAAADAGETEETQGMDEDSVNEELISKELSEDGDHHDAGNVVLH